MEGQTTTKTAPPALPQVSFSTKIILTSTFLVLADDEEMKR